MDSWVNYIISCVQVIDREVMEKAFDEIGMVTDRIEAAHIVNKYYELKKKKGMYIDVDGYNLKKHKLLFCAWCRKFNQHDFYYGMEICHICGDNYIEERSEKVRLEQEAGKNKPRELPTKPEHVIGYLQGKLGIKI
jgi:hypothetical protein